MSGLSAINKRVFIFSIACMYLLLHSGHSFSPFPTINRPNNNAAKITDTAALKMSAHERIDKSSAMFTPPKVARTDTIQNFRAAMENIYRCANTDGLADVLDVEDLTAGERFLLYEAGLVLDLRSDAERHDPKAQLWMSEAPGGSFEVVQGNRLMVDDELGSLPTSLKWSRRAVVRLDVLSPSKFMEYLEGNWLTMTQKLQLALYKVVDGQKLHNMRIGVLNQRGLFGLNEAILETGKKEILKALQTITLHLEQNPRDSVVVHCVQGKDRTGLLIMLCQSIVGMSDTEIIEEYHRSHKLSEGSAAALGISDEKLKSGKLDRRVFSGAPRETMEETLTWLRSKYGSVSPGYLDDIGFDSSWRKRFSVALNPQTESKL